MAKKIEVSEPVIDQLLSEIGDMFESLAKSEKSDKKAEMKKDEKAEDAGEKEMDEKAEAKKAEKKPSKKMAKDESEWSDQKGADKKKADSSKDMTAEMTKDEWSDRAGEDKKPSDSSKDVTAEMTKDEEHEAPDMGGEEAPPAPPAEDGCEPEGLEDQGASDEELHEIYSAMSPEDLEHHYMVIKSLLAGHYGSMDQGQEEAPPAPAPEEKSLAMGEKKEMEKSEKSEVAVLKAQLADVNSQVERLVKALDTAFKPQRKAVQGIEWLRKSGHEEEDKSISSLSKSDKKEKIRGLSKSDRSKLTSTERQAINEFFLTGESEKTIDKIIEGMGSK